MTQQSPKLPHAHSEGIACIGFMNKYFLPAITKILIYIEKNVTKLSTSYTVIIILSINERIHSPKMGM